VLNIAGGRPSVGSAPSAASRLFPCHICSIPIHHPIFVLRAGVVLHRGFSSIGGLSCHIDDQWTTPPLSPSHRQWAYSVCLCCLCLFIFWYVAECDVHTCGSTRYTQMVLDSVLRSTYILCVVCNMIISVLFDNVCILTAYNSGKYMYHLL
jgi:hypothetical protein